MLNKRAFYGDDWGVPSAEHPAGECLNRSAPGVEDGSYFEKSWVNDLMSLPGALMNAAGYAPNGTEDTATASQVFDALVNGRWSAIGNYSAGSIVTASNGRQYYCNKASGRDTAPVDPTADSLDNWREYPYESVLNSNGIAKKWFNGDLEVEGVDATSSYTSPSQASVSVTFPVPFVSSPNVIPSLKKGLATSGGTGFTAESTSNTGFDFFFSSSESLSFTFNYLAKGKWV